MTFIYIVVIIVVLYTKTLEARENVKDILASTDSAAASMEYLQSQEAQSDTDSRHKTHMDKLKVAEYALLVAPVVKGVETFLKESETIFEEDRTYTLDEIIQRVGIHITENTLKYLLQDENAYRYTRLFAEMRGRNMADRDYAEEIAPLELPLANGAQSSVTSIVRAIRANAAAIARESTHGLPQADHIALTRASHRLTLAHPLVHLSDLSPTSDLLENFIADNNVMQKLLRYNTDTGVVHLSPGLQHWQISPDETVFEAGEKHEDVLVGCPFSFGPKEIRVKYYETLVDLIATHNCWHEILVQPSDNAQETSSEKSA